MEALETLFEALIPISICAVLPVLIVWLYMRNKTNETNRRAEIMKLAIENNTQQTDLSGLLSSLNKKEKGVKERLLNRLQLGAMSTALGLALLGAAIWQDYQGGAGPESLQDMYLAGAIFLLVGIAVIITFFISKKMLKQEMEAEAEEKANNKN
ncbi:MAG: hypothetical protein UHL07_00335 [Bacteroidaceae bacterium]|nr:hypothetical protein [Bacteroidaceae bacterium]